MKGASSGSCQTRDRCTYPQVTPRSASFFAAASESHGSPCFSCLQVPCYQSSLCIWKPKLFPTYGRGPSSP